MNEENKDALNNLIQSIQDKMGSSVNGSDDSNNNVSSSNTPILVDVEPGLIIKLLIAMSSSPFICFLISD